MVPRPAAPPDADKSHRIIARYRPESIPIVTALLSESEADTIPRVAAPNAGTRLPRPLSPSDRPRLITAPRNARATHRSPPAPPPAAGVELSARSPDPPAPPQQADWRQSRSSLNATPGASLTSNDRARSNSRSGSTVGLEAGQRAHAAQNERSSASAQLRRLPDPHPATLARASRIAATSAAPDRAGRKDRDRTCFGADRLRFPHGSTRRASWPTPPHQPRTVIAEAVAGRRARPAPATGRAG